MRQFFDIQATGSDIGCHQHADIAGFKISQRTRTRTLRFVTVNSRTANAIFIQLFCQVVCPVFGTGEHQHLTPVALTDHLGQQFPFTFLIHKVNVLSHLLGGGITARDFDFQRVMQQLFGQCFNVVREGRREQQVLAFCRQFCQHAANIVNEAHVEHTICFIQHQNFDVIQFYRVLMFQVEQTARRGHQDIDTTAQFHHLRIDAHAAKHHQRTNVQVLAVVAHVFANLRGEFTGWREDQRAYRATPFRMWLGSDQML